jgi:hypothetical protein
MSTNPITLYPGGDDPVTPNLKLALKNMSLTTANNFEIIDASVGISGPFTGDYYAYPPFQGTTPINLSFFPGFLNVFVIPVYISRRITLTKATISITSVSAAPNVFYYFAIYNAQTLALQSFAKFPIGVGSPTGIVSQNLSQKLTVQQGMSLFCYGSDDVSGAAIGQGYLYINNLLQSIPNAGHSTVLISGGTLPSNLVALAAGLTGSTPFVLLS